MKTIEEYTPAEKAELYEKILHQREVRKEYNERNKDKRRLYNKKRWALLKAIKDEFEAKAQ